MPVIRAVILWIKTGSDSYRYSLRSDSTSLGRGDADALGQTAFPPFLRPFGLWNRQKIALGFVLFVVPPATGLGARRRPASQHGCPVTYNHNLRHQPFPAMASAL